MSETLQSSSCPLVRPRQIPFFVRHWGLAIKLRKRDILTATPKPHTRQVAREDENLVRRVRYPRKCQSHNSRSVETVDSGVGRKVGWHPCNQFRMWSMDLVGYITDANCARGPDYGMPVAVLASIPPLH